MVGLIVAIIFSTFWGHYILNQWKEAVRVDKWSVERGISIPHHHSQSLCLYVYVAAPVDLFIGISSTVFVTMIILGF